MENVIRNNSGTLEYFPKNFEMDYSFYQDEPYSISFNDDGSVHYIEFSDDININLGDQIKGIVHNINNYNTPEYDEKTQLFLSNKLKFPFAIGNIEDSILLDLDLQLTFKAGFIGKESTNNILLSQSDYDINLEFYKRNGQDEYIGTLHLEDYSEVRSQYILYDCFDSGNELVINVTVSFNGLHQGRRLNGKFALEILDAEIDSDLVGEKPSLDMVELFPMLDGTQYINMSRDFLHNPYFADIIDLYGYGIDSDTLELLASNDYYIGSLRYFSDFKT